MKREDKQLLLKDLCARLPYGVFVNIEGFDYDFNGKLVQVYFGNINRCSIQVGSNISYSLEETKPWLRPMSSMTEEEKKDALEKNIAFIDSGTHDGIRYGGETIQFIYEIDTFDWLNAHHFDYRGLIEKRLAISTEEYNPYKS